ncbi:MAG: hypothetical protein WD404_00680 [Solirubrobacterales bacterium]
MPQRSRSIQVERTLRPIRLAFLVQPSDGDALRRSIEAATSRWGGMLSAIVPRYRRRPSNFPDRRISANEIVKGYLRVFEPDFVVETEEGIAEGLDLDSGIVGKIQELENADYAGNLPWGLSAIHLYRDAYNQEFRFLQRRPMDVCLPTSHTERDALFLDALFGRLPTKGPLKFIGRGYDEAFDPNPETLDCSSFHALALSEAEKLTPLRATMRDLQPGRGGRGRLGPIFMVLRPSETADLIDFWNVRALGARVAAVPSTHIEEFVEEFERLVKAAPSRSPFWFGDSGQATALGAQGLDSEALDQFAEVMAGHGCGLSRQPWFPPLWDTDHLRRNNWARFPVEADSDRIEVAAGDGQIRFLALAPTGGAEISGNSPSWANVIHLRDWSWSSDLAPVLPPELRDMRGLLGTVGQYAPTASSEGIILCKRYAKLVEAWSLPRGLSVFAAWLKGRGFDARLSPAGRSAEQLIAALGGPIMATLVQEPDLIRLINDAARGLVEEPGGSGPAPPRRRVIGYADLQRVLNSVIDEPERAETRLGRLLETNVLRQGLLVRCSLCEQENWFSLEELATKLTCERCLQNFDFPRGQPPDRKRWAYRPNGPFSAENFAAGGYAVALALRFFMTRSSVDEATWTTSMQLRKAGRELEFDFGLWLREGIDHTEVPKLVLGECKSFGRFEPRDLERITELAREFPECIAVLATLRKGLEMDEEKAIEKLMNRVDGGLSGRLIILTANELCNSDSIAGPPYSWRGKGGRFDSVAEQFERGRFDLADLSRATLQLYTDA